MSLTYNGRPFNAADFAKDIEDAALEQVKEHFFERISSIRDPGTGEFPTVQVLGDRLDDIRLSVEGSPSLIEIVKCRMSDEEIRATTFTSSLQLADPTAFLSYAKEDGALAQQIAEALMAKGINVWWDQWEMGAGASLRQRIDEGLGGCTHFIVLITPISITKPWVNHEIDAGLMLRIHGQAAFIPLRSNFPATLLPPLMSGLMSPEISISAFEKSIENLANDIHGLSRRPSVGPRPATAEMPAIGYSKTATAIAKIFVELTKTALFGDPQMDTEEISIAVGASVEDVEDALHELRDLVTVSFDRVLPKTGLYATFDSYFKDWSPDKDALRIAADLINDPSMPHLAEDVASRYGWHARRLNPALAYLLSRQLIVDYQVLANDWLCFRVVKTDSTRRFVRSRS
ncbi:molecular chaperone Tir [Rhizobium tubonense]|uniref:Molecular chaperone Tir n=2 Tax=Rhizobium tubonense TaxID=484088 RepID=A0A2W4C2S2_9HYPH|nr:molecular chaperone Tir [Rhizobium tubonense]